MMSQNITCCTTLDNCRLSISITDNLEVCSGAGGLTEIFWFFLELQTEAVIVGIVKITTGSSSCAGLCFIHFSTDKLLYFFKTSCF